MPPARRAIVPLSRAALGFAEWYVRRFVRRHFHALRLAHPERWPREPGPLVVCMNHPSWWDPMTAFGLSRFLAPERFHYAPMDAKAVERYGVMRKIGLFPVEQGTPRGAAQLLRAASQVFEDASAVLWVTPQGHFTDVRTRPLVFRAGLAALVRRMEHATVLPLAFEYTFWDERLPEALAMLGEPVRFTGKQRDPGPVLERALENTQDELAELAAERRPDLFTPVIAGSTGISGVYELWQRGRALLAGKRYEPEHASLVHTAAGRGDADTEPLP